MRRVRVFVWKVKYCGKYLWKEEQIDWEKNEIVSGKSKLIKKKHFIWVNAISEIRTGDLKNHLIIFSLNILTQTKSTS